MNRIYLSPPHVSADERRLLLDAFDSNWIAPLGPHVDGFEREFAEIVKVPYAAALSSGTAALHLALLLLDVGQGDEVITSTLTFAATANAITYRGATPVFIDSSRDTWTMDPGLLQEELKICANRGKLPKAVIVVDLYGQCADYDPILSVCEEYGVPVVEDAAEALGSTYRGRSAGAFGSLAAFSFNGNKIITTSGGGMLVSHRSDWIERARFFSTQARDNAPHYQHSAIGYNYRMSNLLAAVGRGQLRNLSERVRQRRANAAFYEQALQMPGITLMPEAPYGRCNRWLTCITVDPAEFGASREHIRTHLETRLIEARPIWKPMHLQPAFAGCRARGGSVSQDLFEHGLCLPSGSSLTSEDRDRVVAGLLEVPRLVASGALGRRAADRLHEPRPASQPAPAPKVNAPAKRQVLIVGAGTAGGLVVRDMLRNRSNELEPIGFIDDDPKKRDLVVHGIPVLGNRQELARVFSEHAVTEVVIALPSARPAVIRSVLRDFEPFKVQLKTLPALQNPLQEIVGVEQLRDMRMEDLLQRAPVGLNLEAVRALIGGRRVLITGAGGATGMELARQVSDLSPASLILLDMSDHALKRVYEHVSRAGKSAVPVLADVTSRTQIFDAIQRHQPSLVFHAAIQNDAPLMEENPAAAVRSNVLGTRLVAKACHNYGAERFVLLSTTKAVNPTTVVGATRRITELIVCAAAADPGVVMCGVRLSNVLGRPGSVVPVMSSQIDSGGPVTVSHPDVRRYLMLASEMVQLVLHAAGTAEPGMMYVLDMGEQIRIVDLARDLIRLKGLLPDDEIPIQFTGLAQGERLYEELANTGEIVTQSPVERILKVRSRKPIDTPALDAQLDMLIDAGLREDRDEVRRLLRVVVAEYAPDEGDSASGQDARR
jgi:FlaA1/EpsC-like NDP-sugar epimerase